MNYVLHYGMMTGRGQREILTAAQAVLECKNLQAAGAGSIVIVDSDGVRLTLPELAARAASSASAKSDRWAR